MPIKPHELLSGYNLKSVYLHYHSAYGHQTWKAGGLLWGASTHNVTLPFGQVVLRDRGAI